MAGNRDQIQATIDAKIIPSLVELCNTKGHYSPYVRGEACWCISNATEKASPEQVAYLVDTGCLEVLCSMLNTSKEFKDNGAESFGCVVLALEGLQNIVKAGEIMRESPTARNPYAQAVVKLGCVPMIEKLRHHTDLHMKSIAKHLLQAIKYGIGEDDVKTDGKQEGAAAQNSIELSAAFEIMKKRSGSIFQPKPVEKF